MVNAVWRCCRRWERGKEAAVMIDVLASQKSGGERGERPLIYVVCV
jgi:hypothetical protein